ncbi:MAG: HAMP domain-containing sensor histidine kinase [Candidatus Binatia bacterium]
MGTPLLDSQQFEHLGGGRKGAFLLLRYVFIIAAAYLIIFDSRTGTFPFSHGLMIAAALGSNVALSMVSARFVFSWYVEAPVLIADTLWVSWALHSTSTSGEGFFLLYFFVLCLAALGENMAMVLLGSTAISAANVYWTSGPNMWTSPNLLRIVFFYTAALFYGYVINEIKQERQRAVKGMAWARELEDKVAERTSQLQRLYDEAEAASRVKSEFLATVSHELRTPLVAVLGYTELLLDGEFGALQPDQHNALQRVHYRGQELLEVINATLDVSRLEAEPISLDVQTVDTAALLTELQGELQRISTSDGVRVEWDIPASLPALATDPGKLKIVLRNLVRNALKFTERGHVKIRAQPCVDGIELCVSDTGIGIAADMLPVIFEPFRQVDGADTRRFGGVGLGLYLVRRLVDLLGGQISVASTVGEGSTFRVQLPLTHVGSKMAQQAA